MPRIPARTGRSRAATARRASPLALLGALVAVLTSLAVQGVPASRAEPGPSPAPPAPAATPDAGQQGESADDTEARREAGGRAGQARRIRDSGRRVPTLGPVVDPTGSGTATPERPNILVLMLDDMRFDDMPFMPHTRRLIADQGVTFDNAFAPQPLCCPARASFLTGLLSHHHRVWSHREPFGFRVFRDERTLPVWLQRYGYTTSYLGKYLNGYGEQRLPDGRRSVRYVPPGWTDWRAAVGQGRQAGDWLKGGTYKFFDTTLNDNGRVQGHPGVYQTHGFSRIVQDQVRAQAQRPAPWFSMVGFAAPHTGKPLERGDPRRFVHLDGSVQRFKTTARPGYVKGRFDEQITTAPGWPGHDVVGKPLHVRAKFPVMPEEWDRILQLYRQRVEAMSVVDDEVVNIVRGLRGSGELDETYVVLTSDNGYFLGEHRRRKDKILPYDPSLRVPLVVRGPGVPAGERRSDPFLMPDFAPTILSLAAGGDVRLPVPPMDGVDMSDVLHEGDRGWDRPVLTETGPIKLTPPLLEVMDVREERHGPNLLRFSQGVRTGEYLYVEHASSERELYDLRRDPEQHVNVVGEPRYAEQARLLREQLGYLRSCRPGACMPRLRASLRTDDPAPPYLPDPARPMD